jgi:hypothetical protein
VPVNDEQANVAVIAALELAVSVRDDGPAYIAQAARRVVEACGGDPVAALTVLAALVKVDEPVDAWWQRGLDGVGQRDAPGLVGLAPHGTHAAFNRHRAHDETPCRECADGERAYQAERARRRRAA